MRPAGADALSTRDIAKMCRRSVGWVCFQIYRGRLPATKVRGRWKVAREDAYLFQDVETIRRGVYRTDKVRR
jgi:hypothetical protein